jgi:hypothetical protein
MTISDPDQTPLDPDTGDRTTDLPGDDVLDGVADGDVLADPDVALDDAPRGTDDDA